MSTGHRAAGETADEAAPSARREQRGWYFYDWAYSAFSTTVLTVFLGPYLTSVAKARRRTPTGYVHPLGIPVARRLALRVHGVRCRWSLAVLVMPLVGARRRPHRPQEAAAGGCPPTSGAAATTGHVLPGRRPLSARAGCCCRRERGSVACRWCSTTRSCRRSPRPRSATRSPRAAGPSATRRARWCCVAEPGAVSRRPRLLRRLRVDGRPASVSASAGLWWAAFTHVPLLRLRDRPALAPGPGAACGQPRAPAAARRRCATCAATR